MYVAMTEPGSVVGASPQNAKFICHSSPKSILFGFWTINQNQRFRTHFMDI